MDNTPMDDILRHSARLVRQGAELRRRMHVSISTSNTIIDRSRKLLADWPVTAAPRLQILETISAAHLEPSDRPPGQSAALLAQARAVEAETNLVRVVEQTFAEETLCLDNSTSWTALWRTARWNTAEAPSYWKRLISGAAVSISAARQRKLWLCWDASACLRNQA